MNIIKDAQRRSTRVMMISFGTSSSGKLLVAVHISRRVFMDPITRIKDLRNDSQAKGTAHDISTARVYEDLDQWPEHHELSRLTQNRT
jgi:hypothetical protein